MTKKRKKKKKVDRYANLLSQYQDPTVAGSLGGVTRFAKARQLPVAKVREKLETDLGYTLHKPTRRRFRTLPVLVFAIDDQWVADLIEVGNIAKSNRGYRYLLTVVDVLSKYAWVEPVKTKTGKDVTAAFEKILKRSDGRTPRRLQTDDGKEFYNKTFPALMKRKDIRHFSTSGDTKASIIERFNRTLKKTHVSLLHRQEHVELFTRLEGLGDGVQSLVPSQHQDGPRESDGEQRRASVEEFVRQAIGGETNLTQVESRGSSETQQEI